MTERIRWEPTKYEGFNGHVGTLEPWLFQVWQSSCDTGDYVLGEWVLTAQLPGPPRRSPHGSTPDELKAEAEKWLERFVSSLGAVFPEDGEPLEVKYAPGRRVRFAYPENGYPGEGTEAAQHLTIGEVYTIAWADIGPAKTLLNLTDAAGKRAGQFNSVLFEPADDDEAAATAAAREE